MACRYLRLVKICWICSFFIRHILYLQSNAYFLWTGKNENYFEMDITKRSSILCYAWPVCIAVTLYHIYRVKNFKLKTNNESHRILNIQKQRSSLKRLIAIMDELREKCPWDRKQTIQTLRPQTIEETYELADAILNNNWSNLKEELGDVLLHIVFYSKIATEKKEFTLQEVIQTICDKLIKRHPHIYGNVVVNDEEDVKKNWEQIKLKEGKISVLAGVPASLPAVVKAQRIQEKAKGVGFEWSDKKDVFQKVEEELSELSEAIETNNAANIEEEFGDVMFSLVNYARFINVDAEAAIEKTNQKFMKRFGQMEKWAKENGTSLNAMTLAQMDDLWNNIKQNQKQP